MSIKNDELLAQVSAEYNESLAYWLPRKTRWASQLVLMNNLLKPVETIQTSSAYSFFLRAVSGLYSGDNVVTFTPPESDDYQRVEMLNLMYQNDYQESDKKTRDYDKIWTAGFFGFALEDTLDYDKKRKLLLPEIWNPLYCFTDPYGQSPNRWRYYGVWVTKDRATMLKMAADKDIELDKTGLDSIASGIDPYLWDYKTRTDKAKSANPPGNTSMSRNDAYQLLRWHTVDPETGEKLIVLLDRDISKIVKRTVYDRKGPNKWPVVQHQVFKDPYSATPTSFIDLIEDKTRAMNVLYNLMYDTAKDEANAIYVYDKDMIVDQTTLSQRQVTQHIAIDTSNGKTVSDAYAPLRTKDTVPSGIGSFITMLKGENSEMLGTAQIATPLQRNKKSATESALLQQIADQSTSLQALLLEASEEEYASQWYWAYRTPGNVKSGDEKILQITTLQGVSWKSLDLADVVNTRMPPRVTVTNQKKAEYKRQVMRKSLESTYALVTRAMSPEQRRDYDKYVFFPLYDLGSSTLDIIFPKTLAEIKAEQENLLLQENKLARISPMDDDEQHMSIHYRTKRTAATWAHILAHERQRATKLARQQQLAEQAQQAAIQKSQGGAGGANAMGSQPAPPPNPTSGESTVPLGQEAQGRYANSTALAQ